MKNSIFDYTDYKAYLRDSLLARSENGRGQRSRLAKAVNCHTAYVTQVLNGHAHFSLEQSELVSRFLGHTKDQAAFFLLLVQHDRAGTSTLRAHFNEQMKAMVSKQFVLKDRLDFKRSLLIEDQAIFYSSWHYGAAHVAVSIPGCQTEQGIAEYLRLPIEKVTEVMQFLTSVGLVVRVDGKLKVGATHIHLGNDSPMISKHHTNWRLQAVQSLDRGNPQDLHYSSVITASREDAVKIKAILVKAIEDVRAIVKPSKDEAGFSYCIDLFEL